MDKENLRWSDWSIFIGTFYHNNIEGKGTYEWNDERRYEGDWKDNKLNSFIIVKNTNVHFRIFKYLIQIQFY